MLYNIATGLPPNFVKPRGTATVRFGYHAREMARKRKIPLFNRINFNEWNIIEVETTNNKMLLRKPLNNRVDICIVVVSQKNTYPGGMYFIKTCWINSNTDHHSTLNRKNYIQPGQFCH